MTDNEIIKALKHHASHTDECDNCPNAEISATECSRITAENALNLINRQKAEIEKLKTQLGKRENFFTIKLEKEQLNDIVKAQFEKFEVDAVTVKNETIREFAERLKDMHKHNTTSVVSLVTIFDDINNLVKEMTEDLQ